jgi:protein-disulfide isomerase
MSRRTAVIPFFVLLLLASGVPPAAQEKKPAPEEDIPLRRLEILEAEYLGLKNEIALLRERLEALLGPPSEEERIHEFSVGNSPLRGNPDASLTLIEFGDFQSYYATRARHVVNRLLEEYPEDLRFVFKHFPLTTQHPQANEAALAALAAEKQERTWEMHDLLFHNTRRLEPNLYLMLAQQLGMDLAQFDQDRRSLWALERLAEDEKEAVRAGVDRVPTFFLNGRRLKSWRYDFVKSRIDRLLEPPSPATADKRD